MEFSGQTENGIVTKKRIDLQDLVWFCSINIRKLKISGISTKGIKLDEQAKLGLQSLVNNIPLPRSFAAPRFPDIKFPEIQRREIFCPKLSATFRLFHFKWRVFFSEFSDGFIRVSK